MTMTSSQFDHVKLDRVEEGDKPRGKAVRRNLFGPVDHQQLQQDLNRLLCMGAEVAEQRWNFDFENDHHTPGSVKWEEMQCQDVPAFYRSCVVRAGKRRPEVPISAGVEREQSNRLLSQRLDGRQTYDYRNIKITFGTDFGCCTVSLGKTRVLAQVSCELVPPKDSRPTEGQMFFNLELSPMASPGFQPNRHSELLVTLNRQLERCLRNSRCIDTESLCVISGEKVWQIRVDVHILNHDGNLMDAASIAAISALCHFRRPEVAIQGRDITVFSPEEREPVPLSVYHMPVCVSFAFFQQGTYLLVDPCEKEELVKDGLLVIAMNKHREICSIQSSGGIMLLKDQVLRCSKIASVKVSEITELITKALENDRRVRKEGGKFGFAESVAKERITVLTRDETPLEMTDVQAAADEIISKADAPPEAVPSPVIVATGTGQVGEGLQNTWGLEEDDEDEETSDIAEPEKKKDEVMVISDSEEEEVVILNQEGQGKRSKPRRGKQ